MVNYRALPRSYRLLDAVGVVRLSDLRADLITCCQIYEEVRTSFSTDIPYDGMTAMEWHAVIIDDSPMLDRYLKGDEERSYMAARDIIYYAKRDLSVATFLDEFLLNDFYHFIIYLN